MKITSRTTLDQIRTALHLDGYGALAPRASEIKQAADRGCLLWTSNRLTTTDRSRIDARPAKGRDNFEDIRRAWEDKTEGELFAAR